MGIRIVPTLQGACLFLLSTPHLFMPLQDQKVESSWSIVKLVSDFFSGKEPNWRLKTFSSNLDVAPLPSLFETSGGTRLLSSSVIWHTTACPSPLLPITERETLTTSVFPFPNAHPWTHVRIIVCAFDQYFLFYITICLLPTSYCIPVCRWMPHHPT